MSNVKNVINELRKKLDKWAKEYYENDSPSVPDAEYDRVYKLLLDLEQKHPELVSKNSITQKVGGSLDNRFKKIEHEQPMLSLSNAFSFEDVKKFDGQIKRLLGTEEEFEYIVEYKIDGLSISLIYEEGRLVRALTRGNGIVGEDVTHNVMEIKSIPKQINIKEKVEVRGEVFMPFDIFSSLNDNGSNFANPRNAAAGTMRQLDHNVVKERRLDAFLYSMPNSLSLGVNSQESILAFLKKHNFKVNDHSLKVKGLDEVIKRIKELMDLRTQLNYDVDGIVIKINNINLYEEIGYTVKFPKFMIAYKFPAEVATTELLDIFPSVGRTGRITYNAKLAPITLAGTIVTAATLHNASYVKEHNIAPLDHVFVKKAGDIIPKVVGLSKKNAKETWEEERLCPSCQSELERFGEEVDQYCTNPACGAILLASLEHFVSREAMNIEGISSQTLKLFIKKNMISDISDIYQLKNKRDEILSLQGFKEKSLNNILEAIEKSKKQKLDKFIFGLGIRHIGAKAAKILAKRFGSLEAIQQANEDKIKSIRDLGEKASNSVVKYFRNDNNINLINKLKEHGLSFEVNDTSISNILEGKTFVITGTLTKSRNHFKDIIENNGGNVSSAVSRKTTFLLSGENAGSKMEKAIKLGVQIVTETDFKKMLGEYNE